MRPSKRLLAAVMSLCFVLLCGGGVASAAQDTGGPARAGTVATSARVCGWGKVCVTFGHKATRLIDGAAAEGVIVFAGVLCGEVPTTPRVMVVVKAACAGAAAGYYAALKPVFERAARRGKRVEIGWRYVLTTLPTSWRVV